MKEVFEKENGVKIFYYESDNGLYVRAEEDWYYTIGTEQGKVLLNNVGYALLLNAVYDYKVYNNDHSLRYFGKNLLNLVSKKANVTKVELYEVFGEIEEDADFKPLSTEDLYNEILWDGCSQAIKFSE